MVLVQKINPVARAVVTIAAVAAMVTGVTFAALSNTATLTNNTIMSTNIDGLVIDSDGNDSFDTTDQGFAFNNIGPGGTSAPQTFKLKNSTTGQLDVNVQITGESALPAGVDASDITFNFTTPDGTVNANWGQLTPTNGVLLISDLDPDEVASVTVTVTLDASVPDGTSIPSFNFMFGNVTP